MSPTSTTATEKSTRKLLEKANKKVPRFAHEQMLNYIQSIMRVLDIPITARNKKRFERTKTLLDAYNIPGNMLVQTTICEVQTAMSACLFSVWKNHMIVEDEETISLRDFVLQIQTLIFTFDSILGHQEPLLQRMAAILTISDKRIPTEKIQSALAPLIDVIAP